MSLFQSSPPLLKARRRVLRAAAGLLMSTLALSLAASGCSADRDRAEKLADETVASLLTTVELEVARIREGLPDGAGKLGALLDTDPGADLAALQRNITKARSGVEGLRFAKATFFSFTDPAGVVLRSEADPDLLAQKSIVATFPVLSKALEEGAGLAETFGEMDELRGVRTGPDVAWVVAHPVKDGDGKARGLFVSGFSLRFFAHIIDDVAKRELVEATKRDGKKNQPLSYVFVVRKGTAYGAPLTPDVSAKAIEELDVVGKTAAGPFRSTLTLTGRSFAVAARRVPELGDDVALAVLLSEI